MLSRGLQSLFTTNIPLSVLGMMIFITIFLSVIVVLFWKRTGDESFQNLANLPLSAEENHE